MATQQQILLINAYAAQSPKHLAYAAAMLCGRAVLDLSRISERAAADFLRQVETSPKRRPTESAERHGYMIDGGEDN